MIDSNIWYTDEIRNYLFGRHWPKGLIVDTSPQDNGIYIVFYRDNFNTFDGHKQLEIAQIVGETINAIRRQGCPIYLEVRKGNGRVARDTKL